MRNVNIFPSWNLAVVTNNCLVIKCRHLIFISNLKSTYPFAELMTMHLLKLRFIFFRSLLKGKASWERKKNIEGIERALRKLMERKKITLNKIK